MKLKLKLNVVKYATVIITCSTQIRVFTYFGLGMGWFIFITALLSHAVHGETGACEGGPEPDRVKTLGRKSKQSFTLPTYLYDMSICFVFRYPISMSRHRKHRVFPSSILFVTITFNRGLEICTLQITLYLNIKKLLLSTLSTINNKYTSYHNHRYTSHITFIILHSFM